jgi:hypothetical protein
MFCTAPSLSAQTEEPWPRAVPGFKEPEAGEHPRLFFRKSDIPEIRRRAFDTEEGKAMVERLLLLLGENGWELPEVWNTHFPVNIKAKGQKELPLGAFTFTHPAGYGMLYTLTGKQRYADLSQQALERMFDDDLYSIPAIEIRDARGAKDFQTKRGPRFEGERVEDVVITYGQPDRDERYTWTTPGARLRVGPMMVAVALAYDLCYDAWSPEFRQRVMREVLEYNHLPVDYDRFSEGKKGRLTFGALVEPSYKPESNHYPAYIGGAGIALLAFRNDPGAPDRQIDEWLEKIEENIGTVLTRSFGEKGFFAEGHGPSQMAANTGFVPLLQAARVSWGKDFISPRPNGPWLSLRWAMEIIPGADKPYYPNFHHSSYGKDFLANDSFSHAGVFSQGFGAVSDQAQQAALLWTYLNAVEQERPLEIYDAWYYPLRAVYSLINWPIGLEPKNPGEVLGHVNADKVAGHYMFRKSWEDADDIYFTFLLNPKNRRGHVRGPDGGNFCFFGFGIRAGWSKQDFHDPRENYFQAYPDGSGVVSFENKGTQTSIAVDYSERSGAEGVVLMANPWFTAAERTEEVWRKFEPVSRKHGSLSFADVQTGNTPWFIMMMHKGSGDQAPDVMVEGNQVRIGQQRYQLVDGNILMESYLSP